MSLSPRGLALARTFAASFEALKEHQKQHPGEVAVLAGQVASHLRSAYPLESIVPVEPAIGDASELQKLRDEVAAMRPVYVAALAWHETADGDRDHCALSMAIDRVTDPQAQARVGSEVSRG